MRRAWKNNTLSARMTAILVSAAMAVSMTACASTNSDSSSASTEQSGVWETTGTNTGEATDMNETADTSDDAEGNTEESAADTAETNSEEADSDAAAYTGEMDEDLTSVNENPKLQITVATEDGDGTPEGEKITCATAISSITVQESGYDSLQSALDADYSEASSLMSEQIANMYAEFDDTAENTTAADLGYAVDDTIYLKRADEKVISYLHCNYCSFGGAHPSTSYSSRNYASQTGTTLELKDVVTDYDAVYQYVMNDLAQQQSENGYFFDDYETSVGQIFYGPNGAPADGSASTGSEDFVSTVIWYLVDDSLKIVMDTYSIAPYAVGPTVVTIPFTSGLVSADYE